MSPFKIAGHEIGGARCFIIAEAGINHNGNVDMARRLIDTAVEAGADAVKFQTFKTEQVTSPGAPKATYQRAHTDPSESQLEMIRRLELSEEDFAGLKRYADERGILFLSTPFDHESVDFLDALGLPAFKVPSGEVTNFPLLRHVAAKAKPVILSTGMAFLGEVERAVRTLMGGGCPALAMLHCVSNYPADPRDANLRAMATMGAAFDVPTGFSDHTTGIEIALAAAALGASVIEKHFTLDRGLPGPDHQASLMPAELQALVHGIRRVTAALGDGIKAPRPSEADTRNVARRSLFLRRDVPAGGILKAIDVIALRPAGGIGPQHFDHVVGQCAVRDLASGSMLQWKDLSDVRPLP